MGDIPEDVMSAAYKLIEESDGGISKTDWIAHRIAHAILAERQRCADVAQKEGDSYKENGLPQVALGAYTVRRAILEP